MNKCLFFIFISLFLTTHCGSGSGGSTPPTDIPSPVSHMSLSSSDSHGNIRVTGEAEATDAQTTVTVVNTTLTGNSSLLKNAIFRATSATTTSSSTGSFQLDVEGSDGDTITVTYSIDGVETSGSMTVPDNQPALPTGVTLNDLVYNPNTNEVIIVANDDTDGYLYFYDLDTSLYSTITLTGLSLAARIDLDTTLGVVVIIDYDDSSNVYYYDSATDTLTTTSTGGITASDVAVAPGGGYAIVANYLPSPSLFFYDLVANDLTNLTDINNGSGNSQAAADWIDMNRDGSTDIAAVVSLMDDGVYYLTAHTINSSVPSNSQFSVVALTGIGYPAGFDLFNSGGEAVLTDQDNDTLLHITIVGSGGSTASLSVGDEPKGVTVNATGTTAYVVNSADRTVTTVDLSSFTVSSTTSVGLTPTRIVTDPTGTIGTVIVMNEGDNTLTLID